MKTIQRIVVGIDFSKYSPQILACASSVAENNSAEIVAVNVINQRRIEEVGMAINDEHFTSEIVANFIHDETKKRELQLTELVQQWVSKKVPSRTMVKNGIPFEQILQLVDDEKADLLVISSRGRTNFQDYMYGTTAEKIFRYSPVSVLRSNVQ
jgi:nucleotide-binding universal stress UspA family protein